MIYVNLIFFLLHLVNPYSFEKFYCSDPVLSRHSAAATSSPAPRPTSEVLESFNPLQPIASHQHATAATLPSNAVVFDSALHVNSDIVSLGSSALTLVSDGGVTSPDQGIASSTESVKTASATSLLEDDIVSNSRPDSGVESIDILAGEMMDGLKLTECQNMNLDAHRLSAGFAMFDPLQADDVSPVVTPANALPRHNPFSSGSGVAEVFAEQGARPKVAPRISVSDSDPNNKASKMVNGQVLVDVEVDSMGQRGAMVDVRVETMMKVKDCFLGLLVCRVL